MFKYFKNSYSLILILWESLQIYWEQRVWWTWKINDYSKDFLRIIAPERADYHRISFCQLIEMIIHGALGREWTSWNCFHPKKIEKWYGFGSVRFRLLFENVIKYFLNSTLNSDPFHKYKQQYLGDWIIALLISTFRALNGSFF